MGTVPYHTKSWCISRERCATDRRENVECQRLSLTLLFEMATKGQFKPQIGNENKSAEIGGHFTIDKTVQNAIL